jgi:hypothetical protein
VMLPAIWPQAALPFPAQWSRTQRDGSAGALTFSDRRVS